LSELSGNKRGILALLLRSRSWTVGGMANVNWTKRLEHPGNRPPWRLPCAPPEPADR
jgi:hypothetical protein